MSHSRRGFRGRGISDSQRRKKTWISTKVAVGGAVPGDALGQTAIFMQTVATGAAVGAHSESAFVLVSPGTTADGDESSSLGEEITILRARGSLVYPPNSTGQGTLTGTVTDQYAWGFGVTDVRSLVKNVFPGPIIDSDWDGWMFLRQSASAPIDAAGTIVDVKSMRKIESGDALFFAAQAVSGDAVVTPGAAFVFDMRFLILLP